MTGRMSDPVRVYDRGRSGLWERIIDWLELRGLITYESAAEMRWTQHNRDAQARGCPCGKPATVHRDYPDVVGRVPFQWWTCAEHADASGFTTGPDGVLVPTFKRTVRCDTCQGMCSSGGPVGGPTAFWLCLTRPDDEP